MTFSPALHRRLAASAAVLSLASQLFAAEQTAPAVFQGAEPLEWAVRMADSQMARSGEALQYRAKGKPNWDYAAGLFTLSLVKLGDEVDQPKYVQYAGASIGSFIAEDGTVRGYRREDFNLDNLNPGKTVLALYSHTGEERYRKAAAQLRSQLDEHPRTSGGGFWHKKRYPHQMWLDGLYMGAPFYAEYALRFDQPKAFDDVAVQFRLIAKAAHDPKTGLYYHGWDESHEQSWANKDTGTSPNFWSRGIGWFGMGLVDTLDYVPVAHPTRPELIALLNEVAAGVAKYQDPKTGLWYQVTDQGAREGNYLEASASCMFVYTLAKGINLGYLSAEYRPVVEKGFEGILRDLVSRDADGRVSLNRCCRVAGLGYGRDGSYEYYLKEPIVSNDLKAVGPFILACIEMDRLVNPPGWQRVPRILSQIREPQFPDRDFSIVDFGAPRDGAGDATQAIAKAIDACHAAGGGRVIVPAGQWHTGAIHLKSHVNLHLAEGATLLFSTDPAHYLPAVQTRFEGMDCFNYSPFIYAYGQEDIAITGKGTLDGQSSYQNWWGWVKKSATEKARPSLQSGSRKQLYAQMNAGVPIEERQFGAGHHLRPNFIQPYRCRNVLIEGVTIVRSPMWEVHPLLCTNVIVRGLNIVSHGPNNDGCDPESSRNVLIEKCVFDTGDDCIAIKSGRNNDGRRWLMPAENLIIRDCTMKDGHGGTVVGSEISGSCRNVFTEDCEMDSPNLDRALRLKTNAVRGGVIENIFMRNVTVGRVADAILTIDFNYEEGESGSHYPIVRNVVMENVTSKSAPRALSIVGYEKSPIRDVKLIDCTFDGVEKDNVVRHVVGLELTNVKIQRK